MEAVADNENIRHQRNGITSLCDEQTQRTTCTRDQNIVYTMLDSETKKSAQILHVACDNHTSTICSCHASSYYVESIADPKQLHCKMRSEDSTTGLASITCIGEIVGARL